MNHPRVFISYSHDSPLHEQQVLELADRLRHEGIDCFIDQYESTPDSGWPNWMEHQIREAEFVLIVCTETYRRRFNGEEALDKGLGVCWETNIIKNYLYLEKFINNKFIPILFSDEDRKYIPIVLNGYTHYLVIVPDEYYELYRRLTNQPKVTVPEIGKLRSLPPKERQTKFFSGIQKQNMTIIPDINWYAQISKDRSITVRCPFTTVESCPRYYQSLSLLGEAGSTRIPSEEDARLLEYWKSSDLWPRTREYETSIAGPTGDPHLFSNFCPEVAFDRFGYFACFLAGYADDSDIEVAHHRLSKEHALENDWRWSWSFLTESHYTECSIYAVLVERITRLRS